MTTMHDFTLLLEKVLKGDRQALVELMPIVEKELRSEARRHMAGERRNHTLQPTALVNEVYLRLVGEKPISYHSRTHFLTIASKKMREILWNYANARRAKKRGGEWNRVIFHDDLAFESCRSLDLVAFDDELERLEAHNEPSAHMLQLRLLGGLSAGEIAEQLGCSKRTVERNLKSAAMILLTELDDHAEA